MPMGMDMINIKIKNLIKNAGKFEDMQFRLLLEELVRQGGKEAEQVVSESALDDEIDEPVRINLLRAMGYITGTNFLLTLKRILEGEYSLQLRNAAIIAISKYNDNRALNMLSSALKRINNPILQETISERISRIKKDNPILALLPKFLKGVNDPKIFRATLEVLKKILNPSDAKIFIYHLDSDTPFVGDGAFEVLCWRGEDSVKFSIFDFFRKKLKLIDCIGNDECYALQDLLSKLDKFVCRNPDTINYILKELKDLYKDCRDPKVKDMLIDIFSSSHKREVLTFLEDIYNTEPGRGEMVIEKLTGNEDGTYILIYKYKNDPSLKEQLQRALMCTQQGADYLMEIFDSLEPAYQKQVLDQVKTSNYAFFSPLMEKFLLSHDYERKKFALDKIGEYGDSRFHPILFTPEHEEEFFLMMNDYLQTISQVFFIRTFKFFVNRAVNLETSLPLIGKYFKQKDTYIHSEPVLLLESLDSLGNFARMIVRYNKKDLIPDVLELFCSLKTFDYKTFREFQEFAQELKNQRGSRLSDEEKVLLNRFKTNLDNINADLKVIEQGNTNIDHFVEKSFPDYDLLEYILKTHHFSFVIQRDRIIGRIKKVFKLTNDIDAFDAIKFFLRKPDFCFYFQEEIRQSTGSENYLLKNNSTKLFRNMPKAPRFVLLFANSLLYPCFEDQLREILPEFGVTRGADLQPTDIFITDYRSLKTLVSERSVNTKKLYVLLDRKEEFAGIEDLQPKVFPPPLSFYKIIKAILGDLFPH